MQSETTFLGAATLVAAMTLMSVSATAQALPCSWPAETTGSGITNFAYPDTNATYWIMPFDSTRWKLIVISGTYPESRYFSFIPYLAHGAVVNNEALNDVDINPSQGSTNPFREHADDGSTHYYTVTASRYPPADNESNFLQLGNTRLAWILYRIYVPDKGLERNAGVPLPSITVIDHDGRSYLLPQCHANSANDTITELTKTLASQGLDVEAGLREILRPVQAPVSAKASCQPTPLLSLIPKNTGGYFPNPANKYIAVPGLCFQPDRVVVVRGKGAIFPDTFNGNPIWEPPGVMMRYWSMCNNNERPPYPVVGCSADYKTNLDAEGYYTYVVSQPEQNDAAHPPSWIPPDATWLPWGSRITPNVLILRNMLPDSTFTHSVQAALDKGCVINNGSSPSREEEVRAAACAHKVMQGYYPRAVYCGKQVLINEGWHGCFAAAESDIQ
ncbi:MAG: hypothetical protein JO138_23155 [Acidobacteriaceae bacterium]|nr:hypothetical protein [Acidobacteriaceae bacterium]